MNCNPTGEYPDNWPEIAEVVKRAAGWKCVRCNHPDDPEVCKLLGRRRGRLSCTPECTHPHDDKQRVLTVHQLNGNKANVEWWNLASLCQACHLSIQGKVAMERIYLFEHSDWFKPYVAGYYAHMRGLPEDRESVLANMADLLDYTRLPV